MAEKNLFIIGTAKKKTVYERKKVHLLRRASWGIFWGMFMCHIQDSYRADFTT